MKVQRAWVEELIERKKGKKNSVTPTPTYFGEVALSDGLDESVFADVRLFLVGAVAATARGLHVTRTAAAAAAALVHLDRLVDSLQGRPRLHSRGHRRRRRRREEVRVVV